jgi:methionyl-tRNA formyltransferase
MQKDTLLVPTNTMQNQKCKFVFFGTPYVARDTLSIMEEHGYVPSLVITSPDRPRGRGLTLTPTEVKAWAVERDIPVMTPEKLTPEVIEELSAQIKELDAQYAIVVAYGKILPQECIDAFPLGILNIHYSLLPKYRGASPVESSLLHDDKETGVTIQQMLYQLDAGAILASEKVAIEPTETTIELRARLITIGANLLVSMLPAFEAQEITPIHQEETLATKCTKTKKEDGEIFLNIPGTNSNELAQLNWNKYRAYAEWPGTYFFIEKEGRKLRIKITKASFANDAFVIERVVPEGKKEMSFADFLKNNTLPN